MQLFLPFSRKVVATRTQKSDKNGVFPHFVSDDERFRGQKNAMLHDVNVVGRLVSLCGLWNPLRRHLLGFYLCGLHGCGFYRL